MAFAAVSPKASAFCTASKPPPRSLFGWETISATSVAWDQATISVPDLGPATPFATAWVMASNDRPYGLGAMWDQVGWYWWSDRFYLMTWTSDGRSNGQRGCPGTSFTLVPNLLKAGESLTVAVSRSGTTWRSWVRVGRDWKELSTAKLGIGSQVVWSTMLESLPGDAGAIPQVCFSGRVMGRIHLAGGCTGAFDNPNAGKGS